MNCQYLLVKNLYKILKMWINKLCIVKAIFSLYTYLQYIYLFPCSFCVSLYHLIAINKILMPLFIPMLVNEYFIISIFLYLYKYTYQLCCLYINCKHKCLHRDWKLIWTQIREQTYSKIRVYICLFICRT